GSGPHVLSPLLLDSRPSSLPAGSPATAPSNPPPPPAGTRNATAPHSPCGKYLSTPAPHALPHAAHISLPAPPTLVHSSLTTSKLHVSARHQPPTVPAQELPPR